MKNETVFMLGVIILLASTLKMATPCDVETNGCSIPKVLPRPFIRTFTPACNRHDVCYHCGDYYRWSRKQCDKAFKSDMKKACRKLRGRWRRRRCKWTAGLYYSAVRLFGKSHYLKPSSSWCKNRCTRKYGSPY